MEKSYITVVLDKSGSMSVAKKETISGFNEQIQSIENNLSPNIQTQVSLITFNENVEPLFLLEDGNTLEELDDSSYMPRGMTALFDAVDFGIDLLLDQDDIHDDDTTSLFVIISDGVENASKCDKIKVADKIKELESTGRWTFSYMGANVDLQKVASSMNLNLKNMASFDASSANGYSAGMSTTTGALDGYMSTRMRGAAAVADASFYDSDNPDDSVTDNQSGSSSA